MLHIDNKVLEEFKIYDLTAEDEKILWQKCLFVFDSSALLNLYFYSDKTKANVVETIFKPSRDRLWIPNHVLFEFMKNKARVSSKITDRYNTLISENLTNISKQHSDIAGQIKTLKEQTSQDVKHPYIEQNDITILENELSESINKFNTKFRKAIEAKIATIKGSLETDIILDAIIHFFKTAEGHSFDEVLTLIEEGKDRYQYSIPPGYSDSTGKNKKEGTQIFGDLILWKQIVKAGANYKTDVIFINDDAKEDWWDQENKKSVKPKNELIKEFYDESRCRFWMYDLKTFLYKANQFFNSQIPSDEISAVSESSEEEKGKAYHVPIDNRWVLNHWGSECAKKEDNKIVFSGDFAPSGTDGCHIDIFDIVKAGEKYKISCNTKATTNTSGSFMLWCHNHLGDSRDVSIATDYKTPPTDGDIVSLLFSPVSNDYVRIHLQYTPGAGSIEVSNVRIIEIN